jgi:hypothetical protein
MFRSMLSDAINDKKMTDRILGGWTFVRILRLALGLFIVVQGIATGDWAIALLGGLFATMSLWNIGCCGATGCRTPVAQDHKKPENITYEEVR